MGWTPAQQEAIDSRGRSLLVSAAAGSGKTAVLTQRIVALIREGVQVDSLLVVTFTKAAAAEMRARILDTLHGVSDGEDTALAAQALQVEHADISTLHGFCARVCRDYFEAAGVDPTFRIADAAETAVLRAQALEDALVLCFEESEPGDAFSRAADSFSQETLAELVQGLHRFLMARPDPWTWLEQAVGAHEITTEALLESEWIRQMCGAAEQKAQEAVYQYEMLLDFVRELGLFEDFVAEEMRQAVALRDAAMKGCGELQRASEPVFVRRPSKRGLDPAVVAQFAFLRDSAKKALQNAWQAAAALRDPEALARDERDMASTLRGIEKAARAYDALFAHRKTEQNVLDFQDLEHFALKALRNDAVRDAMQARYAFVFVDEYQDSSLLQEALLQCVAREDNLFLVGDVKQSIYRFRLAEPMLFLRRMQQFAQDTDEKRQLIHLNTNFRSRDLILRGINAVFAHVFSGGPMELSYPQEDHLWPGREKDEGPTAASELLLLTEADEEADDDVSSDTLTPEERRAVVQESIAVADRVQALLAEEGGKRYSLRDMVVLLRTVKGKATLLVETLRARGIAAWSDLGENTLERVEILDILSLLKLMDNLRQDIPLLAALRGPALGLAEDELALIRARQAEGSFADALFAYAQENTPLAEAIRAFVERIRGWSLDAQVMPLDALLRHIYNETGYYALVGAQPDGDLRQGNLRTLAEHAGAYQRNQGGGLSGFLRYIERISAHDGLVAQDLGEGDDVLRVMSIHKSKGLQFPVVFLAGVGRKFAQPDARQPLQMHSGLGIGLAYRDPVLRTSRDTVSRAAIVEKRRMEGMAEEARILYVAMTRAEQRLILIGTPQKGREDAWQRAIQPQMARSMLDWVAPVALRSDDWAVSRQAFQQPASHQPTQTPMGALVAEISDYAPPPEEEDVASRLSWEPIFTPGRQLKRSVSSVVKRHAWDEEDESPVRLISTLPERPVFMEQKGMTAAERGSAIHAFLAAIALNTQDVEQECRRMIEQGILSPEQANAISMRKVEQVIASRTWQRMRASDEVHREWAFNLRVQEDGERTLLQGVIDCAFREGDAWVLVDFKSDHGAQTERLTELYRPQLTLYAQALQTITGRVVADRILFLIEPMQEILL